MKKLFGIAAVLTIAAGPALAAKVSESVVLAAPMDEVWPQIGPFCAIDHWHPAVESCALRQEAKGQVRVLTLKGGGTIEEQLLTSSDTKHVIRYRILSSPLPVKDYTATLSATPARGGTKLVWKAKFTPNGASEADARKVISGIFTSGFEGLKQNVRH